MSRTPHDNWAPDKKLEITMELLNNVIQSAVDRAVHTSPSPKTLDIIEQHKAEDRKQFKEILDRIDESMQRILPVVEAYEESQRALESAKASGRFVLWLAGIVTVIGGAILVIKQIFK